MSKNIKDYQHSTVCTGNNSIPSILKLF